ncbi:hypothetical protein JOD45_002538 [Scopulibacillus daqui]|uniref:Uncharacterized protein n=1 Tax=Scopulibacillus daqui TaxID=1469162 RepID=A0ABS2Q1Z9_9BACL|nr:hypothetical protein [Scopulibacillus daqui]
MKHLDIHAGNHYNNIINFNKPTYILKDLKNLHFCDAKMKVF